MMICLLRSSSSYIMATTTRRFHRRTLLLAHAVILLSLLFNHLTTCVAHDDHDFFDCDTAEVDDQTCLVDRSTIGPIRAIVHGTENDPFWQQVRRGMEQTAEDMHLDFEMVLYDDEDPELDETTLSLAMALDIQGYASYENNADGDVNRRSLHDDLSDPPRPAALIVSLPGDSRIETEVRNFQSSGIPMFGINAVRGNDDMSSLFQGTVAMDEEEAGIMAGDKIREILGSKDMKIEGSDVTGIYINHRSDVQALKDRFNALSSSTEDIIKSWKMVYMQKNTTEEEFLGFFEGCKDMVIQLAGGSGTADAVLNALTSNGCNIKDDHIVGTFDTSSPTIYDAMADGTIKFAISQQPYLQGSNAMLMAALYATTGQKLNGVGASAAPGNVQTGPILITKDKGSYPSRDQQICEEEGFPVCFSKVNGGSEESRCQCTDRSKISISVITHDESSEFWNTVFSGISQAAEDFGVSIQKNRLATPPNLRTKHYGPKVPRLKHTFNINEACKSRNADGLIVSLPDATMVDAVAGCESRGIPYVAINAMSRAHFDDIKDNKPRGKGKDLFSRPFLQYVGQNDFESGLEAGKRLIEAGVKKGWCLVHINYDTISERCRGMETAFLEAGHDSTEAKYAGVINVPTIDGIPKFKEAVERVIGQDFDDSWGGVGVLSTGRIQIPALISLVDDHPDMLAGTFDLDSTLYKKDENTLPNQIIFGIDQNAYMEGYLSVATMVWRISTRETSVTTVLETGPNFVVQSDLSSGGNAKSVSIETHLKSNCPELSIKFCGSSVGKWGSSIGTWKTVSEGHPLTFVGKCSNLGRPCGVCEGDCDDDTDCGQGLVCFVRDSLTSSQNIPVPGCNTNPRELTSKDFCVDSRLYQCEDDEFFHVKVGTFSVLRDCAYVKEDMNRCKEYGKYCRETCGYCRNEKDNDRETNY